MKSHSSLLCRPVRPGGRLLLKLGALLSVATGLTAVQPIHAQTWAGPTFREFSGTNHTSETANASLYGDALSWDRGDVLWAQMEPSAGAWDQSKLAAWGQRLLDMRAKGAERLPVLAYTAPWAADKSARTWEDTNWKWTATPRSDGKIDLQSFSKQSDGSWLLRSTKVLDDFSRFPPADIEKWKNYVTKVVNFLRQPPYNVKYFQIWNEAHPSSGFWYGSLDEYMQKIHLPAAAIIRAQGCKVVYGGWPSVTNVTPMVSMLDRNNAWSSIDVLDVHYQNTQLENLRVAAASRGYSSLPIWQTELGYSGDKLFIPDQYPRLLHWALRNNWNVRDKYRMYYYAHQVANDPNNPEYNRTLWTGSSLSHHGQTLQNLANQLGGGTLGVLSGVTSTPALTPVMDRAQGALEAFTVSNRVVIAAHITPAIYSGTTTNLVLSLPLSRNQISKAERVNITGTRVDITSALVSAGTKTNLTAAIKDATGSTARLWNDATNGCKVFYVVITKSATANSTSATLN